MRLSNLLACSGKRKKRLLGRCHYCNAGAILIAHAYLKHHTDLENLDHEKEANNQAKKWGFIRNRTAL
jgi:aerobic-type carbon monoxide dehydrogenase small subunit (CoxS/CutS family)